MLPLLTACADPQVTPKGDGGFETADPLNLPDDSDPVDSQDSAPPDSGDTDDTDTTWYETQQRETGDTGDTGEDFSDCEGLLPAPWEPIARHSIKYWEDFAFDNDGSIVSLNGNSVIRQWLDGSTEVIFPAFGDSRGHLPIEDDKIVISGLSAGLYLIDESGSKERIADGIYILAITIDDDRWVYYDDYSAGKVSRVNLDTLDVEEIASGMNMPDGVVWDSFGKQLYIVENYPAKLTRVPYDEATDSFGDAETATEAFDFSSYLDGVTVDHCGNVYIADAAAGLYRYVPETDTLELLSEWLSGVYTPSVHFGEGYGDFPNDHLYVMDYNGSQLFEFDAQVKGRPNPYVDL